jgi:hypothetical protein
MFFVTGAKVVMSENHELTCDHAHLHPVQDMKLEA